MRDRIEQFNRDSGADLIAIKIGLRAGAYLVVTAASEIELTGFAGSVSVHQIDR